MIPAQVLLRIFLLHAITHRTDSSTITTDMAWQTEHICVVVVLPILLVSAHDALISYHGLQARAELSQTQVALPSLNTQEPAVTMQPGMSFPALDPRVSPAKQSGYDINHKEQRSEQAFPILFLSLGQHQSFSLPSSLLHPPVTPARRLDRNDDNQHKYQRQEEPLTILHGGGSPVTVQKSYSFQSERSWRSR